MHNFPCYIPGWKEPYCFRLAYIQIVKICRFSESRKNSRELRQYHPPRPREPRRPQRQRLHPRLMRHKVSTNRDSEPYKMKQVQTCQKSSQICRPLLKGRLIWYLKGRPVWKRGRRKRNSRI